MTDARIVPELKKVCGYAALFVMATTISVILSISAGGSVEDLPSMSRSGNTCLFHDKTITIEDLNTINKSNSTSVLSLIRCKFQPGTLQLLLERLPPQWLRINECVLNRESWTGVARQDRLELLSIQGKCVEDNGLPDFTLFPNLQTLRLHNTSVTGSGLTDIKALNQLSELGLKNSQIQEKHIGAIQACKSLKRVDITNTPITALGFLQQGGLPQIEHLNFSYWEDPSTWLKALEFSRHLRGNYNEENLTGDYGGALTFEGSALSDSALKSITQPFQRVTSLNLSRTGITDKGIRYLAKYPKLSYLDLSECDVTGDGFVCARIPGSLRLDQTRLNRRGLRALGASSTLAKLSIVGALSPGADPLTALENSTTIHTLDVSRNLLSTADLRAIAEMKRLQHLYLNNCCITRSMALILKKCGADQIDFQLGLEGAKGISTSTTRILGDMSQIRVLELKGSDISSEDLSWLRSQLEKSLVD